MNQLQNIHECAFGFSQRAPKSRQSIINHATFLEGSGFGFGFGSGYAKRDWRLEIEVPLFVFVVWGICVTFSRRAKRTKTQLARQKTRTKTITKAE